MSMDVFEEELLVAGTEEVVENIEIGDQLHHCQEENILISDDNNVINATMDDSISVMNNEVIGCNVNIGNEDVMKNFNVNMDVVQEEVVTSNFDMGITNEEVVNTSESISYTPDKITAAVVTEQAVPTNKVKNNNVSIISRSVPSTLNLRDLKGGSTPKILVQTKTSQGIKFVVCTNPSLTTTSSPIRVISSSQNKAQTFVINSPKYKQPVNNSNVPVYTFNNNQWEVGGQEKMLILNDLNSAISFNKLGPTSTSTPKIIRKKKEEDEIPDFLNNELKQGFRILRDISSEKNKNINWPFLESVDSNFPELSDYKQIIKNPMWLKKVRLNFLEKKYETIKEPVSDIRLVIENCYRYNGPEHPISKKAIKLETMLEQKLLLLSKEIREKTRVEDANEEVEEDASGNTKRKVYRTLAEGGESILLNRVKEERAEKEKELRKKMLEEKKAEREAAYQKALEWDNTLLSEANIKELKAMWELPQIGHFFYLTQSTLNIPEISQFELERILLMPRQSNVLQVIMTSLLANPNSRANLDKRPPMKYRIWQEKLKMRLVKWYKCLKSKLNYPLAVFEQFGIEPTFFAIMGPGNPLVEKQFHELTFHQRIWLIKSLCDYCLHTHKTIQDIISEQSLVDQKEVVLGSDINGYVYIHFPQFCGQDLRIYRQTGWIPPSIDVPVTSMRGLYKPPLTRIERKGPEIILKKANQAQNIESATLDSPHQRPSNLRQAPKQIKREDMVCDNPVRFNANEESEETIDPGSNELNIKQQPESPLSENAENSTESSISQNLAASSLCTDEDSTGSKMDLRSRKKTEKDDAVQTDLSKSIMDFDLEKELAISIRGRCGRKQLDKEKKKDDSGSDESDNGTDKSEDESKVEDEDNTKVEDDEECLDIKKEEIDADAEVEVKMEDGSDEDDSSKIDVDVESNDMDDEDRFELNVQEYLTGGRYEAPNVKKFELVVDSLEALKKLVDALLKEEDVPPSKKDYGRRKRKKGVKLSRPQKNEIELRNRLSNLVEELEPWKDKLAQAEKKTLQRLKKEWDDYNPNTEYETNEEVWESESDDDKSIDASNMSSDEEINDDDCNISGRIKARYIKAARKKERKKANRAKEEEFSVVVSSRGRVRRVKKHKSDIYDYGDEEEASQKDKDTDKSDNFIPEISRKRAKKEGIPLSEIASTQSKKKEGLEDKGRQVYTIKDGVLKQVDPANLGNKKSPTCFSQPKRQIKGTEGGGGMGVAMPSADTKVLNIGGQTIIIPKSNNNTGSMKMLRVGDKTILVPNNATKQQTPVNPTSVDGKKTQIVQLYSANGVVQKVVTLQEAHKMLAESKKGSISFEKNVITQPDGSMMIPVIDNQGKVLYLKMKKKVTDAGENVDPPKATLKPAASNILGSIIQSSIGGLSADGSAPHHPMTLKNVMKSSNQLVQVVDSKGRKVMVSMPTAVPKNQPKMVYSSPKMKSVLQSVKITSKPTASVSQKELTDAVSALQGETFVEPPQIVPEPSKPEDVAGVKANPSTASVIVNKPMSKNVKVMLNKGGKMIPMELSSAQLAGLSPGGSYILNVKSGKLVPVSSTQNVRTTTTTTT